MRITEHARAVRIGSAEIEMRRTTGGVMEIRGRDDLELAAGLGFAHALDRMVQMMLVRLIGQGRLCECLKDGEETLAIDLFMREMGFAAAAARDAANLSSAARAFAEAYAQGVNAYMQGHGRPLELALVGYRPEPWKVEDTLLTILLMSYVGLAQTQQDMEKLIIQAIRGGVSVDQLQNLFRPHLDGLDEEILAAVRRLREVQPLVPPAIRFLSAAPRMAASNNWAVSAKRSASGHAIYCSDPHLEVNRLPAIWYEFVGHTADDYRMGVSMPGVPGLVMGRTAHIALGFTYGDMDMLDYFVEDVQGGRYLAGGERRDFTRRTEVIRRKKSPPLDVTFLETDHGTLEADPRRPPEDGLYLCRAWSAGREGAARSVEALLGAGAAKTVAEAQRAVRMVTISCNWIIADAQGEIGFQQSGLAPARRHSGLHPVLGWKPEHAWAGMVPAGELSACGTPEDGVLASANEDTCLPGRPRVINLHMGPNRVDRIRQLLAEKENLTVEDMKRIQTDLYSLQAERFMKILRPLIPRTPAGEALLAWDLRYDRDSRGAPLFEAVYAEILREVFGKGMFGAEAWEHIALETGLVVDYFSVFDAALLGDDPSWFGGRGREAVFRECAERALEKESSARTWGQERQVMMLNVFFAGTLPGWLGFDHGPIALEGGRSTIVQGAVYRAHGRATTFHPSYRMIVDLATDEAHTALAGGPSGRRTSRYYKSDLAMWLAGGYKTLRK